MKFFRLQAIIGTLPNTLTNGTTADATQVMANLNKIVNDVNANAAPLSNTALLNATNNFTVVQSGVAATAGANFPIASQVQNFSFNTLSSTLGTNAITGRVAALALGAYASGQIFTFLPAQGNTGPANISIDGLGSAIVFSGGLPTIGGEWLAGVPQAVEHDGAKFNLLAPSLRNGTFSPFVTSSGGGSPGSYADVFAEYTRIGNRTFFSLDIRLNTLGSLAPGNISISGLPFPTAFNANAGSTVTVIGYGMGSTVNTMVGVVATSTIVLRKTGGGVVNSILGSDLRSNSEIQVSGSYPS